MVTQKEFVPDSGDNDLLELILFYNYSFIFIFFSTVDR